MFDLMKLTLAVSEAHEMVHDPNLDQDAVDRLRRWWQLRSDRLARHLRAPLASSGDAAEHVKRQMGAVLLSPGSSTSITSLHNALVHYVTKAGTFVTAEENDVLGQVRAKKSTRRIDVVGEQVEALRKWNDDLKALVYAWDIASPLVSATSTNNSINNLLKQVQNDVQKRLENLLLRLAQLQGVVSFVDGVLATAYRENEKQTWDAIDQRLTGNRDLTKGEPWIPQGLEAHVSLTWIKSAVAKLKETRAEIERAMQEVEWAIAFQMLEAEDNTGVASPMDNISSLKEQDWARAFVNQQIQKQSSPFARSSILEHAEARLTWVKTHVDVPDYMNYIGEVKKDLLKNLESRVRAHGTPVPDGGLDAYLKGCIDEINKQTRLHLAPVVGGTTSDGTSHVSYTVVQDVFDGVRKSARAADFAKASDICRLHLPPQEGSAPVDGDSTSAQIDWGKAPTTLVQARFRLRSKLDKRNEMMTGFARWLIGYAKTKDEQLRQEQETIALLANSTAALHTKYEGYKEVFDVQVRQFETLQRSWKCWRLFSWLFREHQRRIERSITEAVTAYCQARTMCPDSEWAAAWAITLPARKLTCIEPLSDDKWNAEYFKGIPLPKDGKYADSHH